MPLIALNTQVLSSTSVSRPALTPWVTSTASVSLSTLGSIGGKQVYGYAFNAIAAATSATAGLSAGTSRLLVDPVYHGSTFAVIYSDRTSSLFTANTAGGSTVAQSLTANGSDTTSRS